MVSRSAENAFSLNKVLPWLSRASLGQCSVFLSTKWLQKGVSFPAPELVKAIWTESPFQPEPALFSCESSITYKKTQASLFECFPCIRPEPVLAK
jgi:hypothetical protein